MGKRTIPERPSDLGASFHPVGYFALLRAGLASGLDVARFGQFFSWAGSIACLSAVYVFLCTATRKVSLALIGIALLGLHPFFRFQALQEGTDMLAAGLQLLALSLVFIHVSGNKRSIYLASAAAGLFLGGAYLIRYTALTLLRVIVIYLWLKDKQQKKEWITSIAIFVGAFLLISLPQLTASAAVTGNPLYNEQARNVWFGLHGDFNWTDNWRDVPPDVTLSQIVRDDPAAFVAHWTREFGRFLAYDSNAYATDPLALERKVTLWEPLLNHIIWLASALLLLFDKRLTRPQIALLLMALFVPVIVTSMAWLFTRYLLVPLAIQVVLVVLAGSQLGERLTRTERAAASLGLSFLFAFALLFGVYTTWPVKQQRTREIVARVREAQPLLESMGVDKSSELMTNNRLYQKLDQPEHPQFLLFQAPNNESANLPLFLQEIQGPYQPDFLLFDWTSHAIRTIAVNPYRTALTQAKDQLAPLQLADDYSVYCTLPCRAEEATPVNEALGPELQLIGYRALASHGDQQGIYLYWKLTSAMSAAQAVTFTLKNRGVEMSSLRRAAIHNWEPIR